MKLIVTSATLDAVKFSQYFFEAVSTLSKYGIFKMFIYIVHFYLVNLYLVNIVCLNL